MGRPEAVLREHAQPVLAEALHSRGVRSAARDEVALQVPTEAEAAALDAPLATAGRADAIYNRFVIEFEPPGSLRPSLAHFATFHAVRQVQQYLRGLAEESGLPLDRLAGCVLDGSFISYITWERRDWRITPPREVDASAVEALLDTLASLATGRGLTAENLDEDFGRDGPLAREVMTSLVGIFQDRDHTARTASMLEQWRIDLGNACGPFSPSDLAEWRELCAGLGVPSEDEWSRPVLFSLHTYFALVAKLAALVILEGATSQPLVGQLTSKTDVWEGLKEMESGRLTLPANAANVIEPGIFSWYLGEQTPAVTRAMEWMLAITQEYSAEIVEITPLAARDVLKDLYQRLLPAAIRHRLGEYYTPDWLAQHVLDQVTGGELVPGIRVLDPSCGSGTFLVEAISRLLARAEGIAPADVLSSVLGNVVGFDLSPLAVQSSKVNYLLALAPLLRHAEAPVHVPVYLADSVSPPRRGGLLEGDVYVLNTSEGEWRLPAQLSDVRTLATVTDVCQAALARQESEEVAAQEVMSQLGDELSPGVAEQIKQLYAKLQTLDVADRDGMWLNLLSNAFAPTFEAPFDVVVGNPPWVSWETLPEAYRRDNEDLWDLYELRPSATQGRRQASENVRLDLAMLFVARSIDRYLRDGGRLGFVITVTVFHSELAGRGFRRRLLSDRSTTYHFALIEDLRRLRVFDEAANQAAVLVAERSPRTEAVVRATRWLPNGSGTVATDTPLEEVLGSVSRRELGAEPADPRDPAAPLLVMAADALEASRPVRRASPYLESIREGINTRGANGIFYVEILGEEGEKLRVRNDPSLGRTAGVPTVEGLVERGAIRQLVRGADVAPSGARSSRGVMFFHDDNHVSVPIPAAEAETRFPDAYSFMKNFEALLRARRPFRNFDPSGDQWLGLYSVTTAALANHKVVVREISQGLTAAPLAGAEMVPDHKLYVVPCTSSREAERLAAVLGSPVVDFLVRSFALSTSLTGSFLRYVGIRDLTELAVAPTPDEDIAQALGLTVSEYERLAAAAEDEASFV